MSIFANLDSVLGELDRLGVKAEGFLKNDDGNPGVVAIGRGARLGSQRVFTTTRAVLEDETTAAEWACIVASLAGEVEA
jgi:hypothetical protein